MSEEKYHSGIRNQKNCNLNFTIDIFYLCSLTSSRLASPRFASLRSMSLTKTKTVVKKTINRKPKVVKKDDDNESDIFSGIFQPTSRVVLTFVANIDDNEKFFESLREYASTEDHSKKSAQKKKLLAPKTPKNAKKPLLLNENNWGNLANANGLLIFFEFETDCEQAEEGTTLMCIGYQNLKMKPDLDNPWSTILPLNEKSLAQFASLEKRTSEKIYCLSAENYEMITSEEQRVALVDFGLYVAEDEVDGEDEGETDDIEEVGGEAECLTEEEAPGPEPVDPKPTPKKKGWFSWIW